MQCAQDEFLKQGSCDFTLDQAVPEAMADYSKLEEFFKNYQTQFVNWFLLNYFIVIIKLKLI